MLSKLVLQHYVTPNLPICVQDRNIEWAWPTQCFGLGRKLVLAECDISTGNRIEARLSGQVRAVMDVHVPAATWDRRHVRKGGRLAGVPRSVCCYWRERIHHCSLTLAAASMNVSCVLAVGGEPT